MISAIRGRLITASFARDVLPTLPGVSPAPASFHRIVRVWSERCEAAVGPASSVRAIADIVAVPLLEILGHAITNRIDSPDTCVLHTSCGHHGVVSIVIVGWNEPLARIWRSGVQHAIGSDSRWCFCCNGRELRIVDARRTWAREFLEFDLLQLSAAADAREILWRVARAEAIGGDEPFLDRAVERSAQHSVELCRALGVGVLGGLRILFDALSRSHRAHHSPQVIFEHSLTVLYRVLFLLFAEARSLVPIWHPVYRDRYSLDVIVTTLLRGKTYRGLWSALNAISRLANAGCSAGDLKVTAFNGRLFAPTRAGTFERTRIDDTVMGRAVVAVGAASSGRAHKPAKIVYRDLDVEQLGAIYEQVLDYEPASDQRVSRLERTSDARKSSGTFYTPKAVTAYLARWTLEPLVRDRDADDILALRILDPAMGSGAFLVAAGRYLASAAEDALVREGRWQAGDIRPEDRVELRREIASKCLFGVDLNPMAVQLARLSLWLASLAADKPLSFLDHHLVAGNSLIGATPDDLRRQPTRIVGRRRRPEPLPLFEDTEISLALEHAAKIRSRLTQDADASAAIVRAKEQTLATLRAPDTSLGRWSRVLDLWCSGWFWDRAAPFDRATFHELIDHIVRGQSALPERTARPLLARAEAIAQRLRFLHWPLTFPEVFVDEHGAPLSNPGFDAVLGNPPWDMVRGDSGHGTARNDRRRDARDLVSFARESGVYRVESRAHLNRYQLFLERALQLAKSGGRVGFVLPSGAMTDSGSSALRRYLFDRADVDSVTGLDNRGGIFQVHRSLRFVLLSCTAGRATTSIACRFGITDADELGHERSSGSASMILTRQFLARLSGEDDLGIPELSHEDDRRIVETVSANVPSLGDAHGWNARFGRELNASDDRDVLVPFTADSRARPVLEGKQIEPFRVSLETCRFEIPHDARAIRVPRRARLAYRDVASATNRLTLIAAIIPPEAVTTHTLFCLKNPLPVAEQRVLCALLNSFVANYLIRLRVNTHVTVALMSQLWVPVVGVGHSSFTRLASLAGAVMSATAPVETMPEYAELQALTARLYGLTRAEFEHVLSTFPLVASETRAEALARFGDGH